MKRITKFTYTGKKMTKAQEKKFLKEINKLRKSICFFAPAPLSEALKPMFPKHTKTMPDKWTNKPM